MFELSEVNNLGNKPIVTLSTDANPFAWAGLNTTDGDLKQMCGISGQGKMFFDIGEMSSRPGWDDPVDNLDPSQLAIYEQQLAKNIDDLNQELEKLVALLRGS